jgi:hypothetical protein
MFINCTPIYLTVFLNVKYPYVRKCSAWFSIYPFLYFTSEKWSSKPAVASLAVNNGEARQYFAVPKISVSSVLH